MVQIKITPEHDYKKLDEWFSGKEKVLLVCDSSIEFLGQFNDKLAKIAIPMVRFSDFKPNPLYESVVKGVEVFRKQSCDSIIAVGGGSAMDVAKCIRIFANLPGNGEDGAWLTVANAVSAIPFLAMPTTAGTGSEATRYAVVYYDGKKQSVTSESCIPEAVLMDSNALKTLPLYQKKATMCDALCHAIESFWSVNSNDESKKYSEEAIRRILDNMDGYLANTDEGNAGMLEAAHIAGKAINITQTTAGHAMCYMLTSMYGIAHGHAAALCVNKLWPYMIDHIQDCTDKRGEKHLETVFVELATAFKCDTPMEAADRFGDILKKLELNNISVDKGKNYDIDVDKAVEKLLSNVNPDRMINHPVKLSHEAMEVMYRGILG